ncbi:TetR/AcrR family transcriptional regulator [Nocardiopsis sp. L17-MgMaSL7]|uniref:TetR/AcrR family transcriptional regulator n=1 Tax=Nocardiopsis sp. L17-MgMaSL7 TaxID=1938893 RepID=UPI000D71C2DF|nr:helix-turn-helix domain-containing protein [Nocardiopsis sp. L17-MgMaSL7]PWV57968.1 TetR family transcriptional regulator [Nocardiopsis sp. L17-MgMaSL7]
MSPSPDHHSQDRPASERDTRAERILDAAEELMVAWGHRKTTIDDVARRAGVGKGTVYLHFPTKERLFLTVLLRAQHDMVGRLLALIRQDPRSARPSEIARHIYLLQFDSPVVHALYNNGSDELSSFSRTLPHLVKDLTEARQKALRDYWDLLEEHGVLGPQLPADQRFHAYCSTVIGHLLSEPLLAQQGFPVPDRTTRADLAAHSLRLLLEQDVPDSAMRATQAGAVAIFTGLEQLLTGEIEEQKRVKRST